MSWSLKKKIYFTREEIIIAFKKGVFPYIDGYQVKKETDEDTDEDTDEERDEDANEDTDEETDEKSTLENEELNSDSSIKGEGLKILTPNQMLNRLPISLAQLNAGNNSDKLKNEITQLLYSLYR